MSNSRADRGTLALLSSPVSTVLLRIGSALAAVILVWTNLHRSLDFDDAYMFCRYALHLRAGLGVSWNLNGVHTLGETSPFWGLLIWLGSFLPMEPGKVLLLASSLSGILAAVALVFAVVRNASSSAFRNPTVVLFLIVASLSVSGIFFWNTSTGMETMLSCAVNAFFCGLLWLWIREPSITSAWLLGCVGLVAFLTRPDSVLPVLLALALAGIFFRSGRERAAHVLIPITVICFGVVVYLTACKLYFGNPLPLPFYVKAHHFYKGYAGRKEPVQRALKFFSSCVAFLFIAVWLGKRKHWRVMVIFGLPLLVTVLYLCTVTQIMGDNARYYVPYTPYLAVPGMMILDEAVAAAPALSMNSVFARLSLSVMVFVVLGGLIPKSFVQKVDDSVQGPRLRYEEATRVESATVPLPPIQWSRSWRDFSDLVISQLPVGATAAATEVGYLGAMNPRRDIIDLSGLNDREVALHGFDMSRFLARKPDVVWLPYMDYTYLRGTFYASREFMSSYQVYDGALTFGVAIRKESPYYAQSMAGMQRVWAKEYAGYAMQDYEVRSATWDARLVAF